MNPIVINGTVLCDPITGIPRFVYEVVTRLDPLLEGTGLDVRLCYRDDGRPLHLPELKNIKIVPLKAIKYSYNLVVLPRYLRKHYAFYVGLASDMLMTRRSVVVLHDIRPLVMKTDRAFFRFKFWFHCLSTKWFARRVFTVSDNQRHLISERLGIPLDKIGVTYNGWEHLQNVQPDMTVFDKLPGVKKKEYYYALGSLAGHKNFKWVREVAARNPDKTFVVAGGKDLAGKIDSFKEMIRRVKEAYPNANYFATTLRQVINVNAHIWGAILYADGNWYVEEPREIPVLDRIGGGDGFVGGMLYACLKGWEPSEWVKFGWATGAMAVTMLEDYATPADEEQVWSVWKGNARVKR